MIVILVYVSTNAWFLEWIDFDYLDSRMLDHWVFWKTVTLYSFMKKIRIKFPSS